MVCNGFKIHARQKDNSLIIFVFHGWVGCSGRQWSIRHENVSTCLHQALTVCDPCGRLNKRALHFIFCETCSVLLDHGWVSFSLYCCLATTSAVTQPQKNSAKMGKHWHDKQMMCVLEGCFSCKWKHYCDTRLLWISEEACRSVKPGFYSFITY